MRAGELRHKVELQRADETQDEFGAASIEWQFLAYRWASIVPLTGREYMLAKQANAEITHAVTIRTFAGLTPKDRVVYGTRVFSIISVADFEERRREMVLSCTEQV
jgi:SPP1 family predicted phage head-tail adaptor